MLLISALAMTAAFCFQAALNVALSNNLIDLDALGVPFAAVEMTQSGLIIFGRLMGGVFLILAARPLAPRSEGVRTILFGGGAVFLVAAGVNAVLFLSSLTDADPMRMLMTSGDADAWTIRLAMSAVFLLCDVTVGVFAILAGVRFRGSLLAIGILVAILCGMQAVHDTMDIWFGTVMEFDIEATSRLERELTELWFDHAELRWRVMQHVDLVTKALFGLLACLTAGRLQHRHA